MLLIHLDNFNAVLQACSPSPACGSDSTTTHAASASLAGSRTSLGSPWGAPSRALGARDPPPGKVAHITTAGHDGSDASTCRNSSTALTLRRQPHRIRRYAPVLSRPCNVFKVARGHDSSYAKASLRLSSAGAGTTASCTCKWGCLLLMEEQTPFSHCTTQNAQSAKRLSRSVQLTSILLRDSKDCWCPGVNHTTQIIFGLSLPTTVAHLHSCAFQVNDLR